jgi:Flp pilus assembly protein TadD
MSVDYSLSSHIVVFAWWGLCALCSWVLETTGFLRQSRRPASAISLCRGIARVGMLALLASLSLRPILGECSSSNSENFEALLRRGFELHRQQQYQRSIQLLKQARILRPTDYSVNLLLGIDTLRSGSPAGALRFLGTALEAKPGDFDALGYLAEAHSELQQFDQAAELLQRAAAYSDVPLQQRLPLIQFYLQRFRAIAEELRRTKAGLAYAYRLQALSLRANRNQEREMLIRVRSLVPELPGLESALGQAALDLGEFESAEGSFSRARLIDANDLALKVGEAILAVHANDPGRAESILSEVRSRSQHRFELALQEWPNSVPMPADFKRRLAETTPQQHKERASSTVAELFEQQCWESVVDRLCGKAKTAEESFWLGSALSELERYTPAIPDLERARVDERFRLGANYWLSLCYAREAQALTDHLPTEGPDSAFKHVVQGEVALLLATDGPAAVIEYRKAVAALPEDPAAWSGLAAAQLLAGDLEGARVSAHQALQLDPGRIAATRVYAEASIQQRDYGAAIPPLHRVLQGHPDDLAAKLLLGTAYSKTGQDDLALTLVKEVLSHGYPDEKGTIHYLLGTVLRRLGREKEAEQAFVQAQTVSDAFAKSGHGLAGAVQ